jgi:hypothetical protein
MAAIFSSSEDNPSDQIARLYENFRSDMKSLMFAVFKACEIVEDAQGPTISSFEHRNYFILEFTFSVDYPIIKTNGNKVTVDTLEINVVFNIVDRKILKIEVDMDGIQWDEDVDVSAEQFNQTANEIREKLKRDFTKQALNPSVFKDYERTRIQNFAETFVLFLSTYIKNLKHAFEEGEKTEMLDVEEDENNGSDDESEK